jgi:hypothetical protein
MAKSNPTIRAVRSNVRFQLGLVRGAQVAVVSIFVTALPFAGLIAHWGPKLLARDGDGGFGGALEAEDGSSDDDNDAGGVTGHSSDDGEEGAWQERNGAAATTAPSLLPLPDEGSSAAGLNAAGNTARRDAVSSAREEDLLGIGLYVPVLKPPPNQKTRESGAVKTNIEILRSKPHT